MSIEIYGSWLAHRGIGDLMWTHTRLNLQLMRDLGASKKGMKLRVKAAQ